jgi:hypothetical protein
MSAKQSALFLLPRKSAKTFLHGYPPPTLALQQVLILLLQTLLFPSETVAQWFGDVKVRGRGCLSVSLLATS